jgi:Taurine catabolism dioxygenase TauD, TfdA family
LHREHPEHLKRLRWRFAFERAQLTLPGQAPVSWGAIFEEADGRLRVRYNRPRIEMAPALSDVPLTREDVAALDALDEILSRPDLQFRHTLSPGEFLVVDNHRVLHGRSAFTDECGAGRQRRLVRVLLARRADPRGGADAS